MSSTRYQRQRLSLYSRILMFLIVTVGAGWRVSACAQNLYWQNNQTGDAVVWYLNGVNWAGNYDYLGKGIPTQWQIVANGDFNGDGTTDFIWQNTQTGDVSYWLMNGTQRLSSDYIARGVPLAWKIVGAADFNGDSKLDLVWQNVQTGDVVVWYMNGVLWSGAYDYLGQSVPTQWRVSGVADLNSDGKPDLVWWNAQTGDISFWAMNGTQRLSSDYIAHGVPLVWKIVGVGDFNNDGKLDFVWQNISTGDVTVWYMNGFQWTGSFDYVAHSIPLIWRIVGTNISTGGVAGTIQ